MHSRNNLVSDVQRLKKAGYSADFKIVNQALFDVGSSESFPAKNFEIDEAFQYEGPDQVEDSSLIYAISIPEKGIKGLLIDAFDVISSFTPSEVTKKIRSQKTQIITEENTTQELKFGFLPKVHKAKFDQTPHRYELRLGFPDFPACPFSEHFSMLGYDRASQQYVWLSTSILKDPRLITVRYKS